MANERVPARLAVGFSVLVLLLEVASLVCYAAAAGFPAAVSVPPHTLLASGPTGSELIRWGSVVDMLGYLCLPPVALHLRDRYRGARFIDLYAVAGLVLAVIGSIGAAVMATAAPALIDAYHGAAPPLRQAIEPVFATLYRGVVIGLWQTLETIPAAVWLIGTGLASRGRLPRVNPWILLVAGAANAVLAVYRLTGI